jgi:hypothetical protein
LILKGFFSVSSHWTPSPAARRVREGWLDHQW